MSSALCSFFVNGSEVIPTFLKVLEKYHNQLDPAEVCDLSKDCRGLTTLICSRATVGCSGLNSSQTIDLGGQKGRI